MQVGEWRRGRAKCAQGGRGGEVGKSVIRYVFTKHMALNKC